MLDGEGESLQILHPFEMSITYLLLGVDVTQGLVVCENQKVLRKEVMPPLPK